MILHHDLYGADYSYCLCTSGFGCGGDRSLVTVYCTCLVLCLKLEHARFLLSKPASPKVWGLKISTLMGGKNADIFTFSNLRFVDDDDDNEGSCINQN